MKDILIKNRYTDKIILSGKYESIKDCLQKNLREADLREADLREADLRGANLWGANLRGADLREASLRRADLGEADLRGADLREADLREADLREADLRGADLWGADLREANLWGANLREADLRRADLRRANLGEANLGEANLGEANLGADLGEAKIQISALLYNIKWGELSDTMTLELMRHDAEFCGENKMTIWANGGECPYNNLQRDFKFNEKKELWKPGKPKHRGMELFQMLCKEKGIKR